MKTSVCLVFVATCLASVTCLVSVPVNVDGVCPITPIAAFDYNRFNSMQDIDDIPKSDIDLAKINTAGHVILDHGLASEVGVWLRHRHFAINRDERVVGDATSLFSSLPTSFTRLSSPQVHDNNQSALFFQVQKQDPTLVPYSWTLEDGAWHPMQFVDAKHALLRNVSEHLQLNGAFLADFAEALQVSQANELFGLSLNLGILVGLGSDMVLLEDTDYGNRIQVMGQVNANAAPQAKGTFWSFNPHRRDNCRCSSMCNSWGDGSHTDAGHGHY